MQRTLSFENAKQQYPHRYTMEFVPSWAALQANNGKYYAPQYRSDREWYEKTLFVGETALADHDYCYSSGQTWPLGEWLERPYQEKK